MTWHMHTHGAAAGKRLHWGLRRAHTLPIRHSSMPWGVLRYRYRHLIAAALAAVIATLILTTWGPAARPSSPRLVLAHAVTMGDVLEASDLRWQRIPDESAPQDEALQEEEVRGRIMALSLPEGTILTASMLTYDMSAQLRPSERLIEVPVEVGAGLAQPGVTVDVIGQEDRTGDAPEHSAVLAESARIVSVMNDDEGRHLQFGTKVTLVVLAVPSHTASLILRTASRGWLGLSVSSSQR